MILSSNVFGIFGDPWLLRNNCLKKAARLMSLKTSAVEMSDNERICNGGDLSRRDLRDLNPLNEPLRRTDETNDG